MNRLFVDISLDWERNALAKKNLLRKPTLFNTWAQRTWYCA